jgi:hypothetical protein
VQRDHPIRGGKGRRPVGDHEDGAVRVAGESGDGAFVLRVEGGRGLVDEGRGIELGLGRARAGEADVLIDRFDQVRRLISARRRSQRGDESAVDDDVGTGDVAAAAGSAIGALQVVPEELDPAEIANRDKFRNR